MTHLGFPGLRAGLAVLAFAPAVAAQTTLFELQGTQVGDSLGQAVGGAGDVNGDGFDDFIVGAPSAFTNGSNAGLARVYSGVSGTILYEVHGPEAFDFLGNSVAGAGDVDKDGYADFVIGLRGHDAAGLNAGAIAVFSGFDGSQLFAVVGDAAGDGFGHAVAGAGDVDNDSYDDIVVGMPRSDQFAFDGGGARVISGRTGQNLFTFYGLVDGDSYGTAVAAAGDVDGDGYDDFMASSLNGLVGSVSIISGKNGKQLLFLEGDPLGDGFGRSIAGVGDTNSDGFDDVLVGAPFSSLSAPGAGAAYLFSGLDGGLIRFITGTAGGDAFGLSVGNAGDVNGDGSSDYVIGAPGRDVVDPQSGATAFEVGEVGVYSGNDGSLLYSIKGKNDGDLFGWSSARVGDANGDGTVDFLVGAILGDKAQRDTGTAQLISGRELPLRPDIHEISLSAGGTQTLSVFAKRADAGSIYWFAGGASGTHPGILTPFGKLPLNYDFYTQFTVSHPMAQALKNAVGVIDAKGRAECRFQVPPLSDPSLSGLTLHHAFGLLDPNGGGLYFSSNAVPVTLLD